MTAETTAGAEAYFRLEELGIPAQPEPFCEQISEEEFFLYACRQAQQLQNGCRQLQGPHYGEINAVLSDVDRELKAIHPHLTPEHLMSVYYQSAEAKAQYKWINRAHYVEWKVEDLRRDRTKRLRALGGQWAESDEIRLPAGLLNEPIYSPQYDVMKCFNACFRMVFQGVTNHLPTENSVAKGMRHEVVHDEEFLNILILSSSSRASLRKAYKC